MCRAEILTLYALLISLSVVALGQSKSIKRSQKDLIGPITDNDLPSESRTRVKGSVKVPPAILAIEIVDPDDNSTSSKSKNSKRTIDSNLGYGAPGNYHYGVSNKPQLVYYKYSQHDIPGYQGNSYYPNAKAQQQINVQKSVEYDLGTQVQYYQPGTTLFTTFDQNGQFGQLSNQVPVQNGHGQNVPIVYLKIYSNQLANNGLYANLPQTHPYSSLNTVNLQQLLAQYFGTSNQQSYQQDQNYQQHQNYYSNQPETTYQQNYQAPIGQYQYQLYQQPAHDIPHTEETHEDELPTHENYPDDAHTRVIFHSNRGHIPHKTYTKTNIPPPQSYSSLEFKPSQQDYSLTKPTLAQEQDQDGYYYYKPQSNQVYVQDVAQGYQQQYVAPQEVSHQVEGHSTGAPYNYHAHPLRGKKRNVRRPESLLKTITKIKQED